MSVARKRRLDSAHQYVIPGRANGSRECAPDDRLRVGPGIHLTTCSTAQWIPGSLASRAPRNDEWKE